MKEFVEKLIERLEEELHLADKDKREANVLQFDRAVGYANGMAIALEIVNQLAEEFATDINVGSKAEQIADDLSKVLKEAKSMGCKEVKCFHHVPLENVEITINALKTYNQDLIKKNQGWILCSERLPENYETVNITWINKKPAPYYEHIKDKPFTGTAIFHHGKWYWYSCVCEDYLRECGDSTCDRMDKDIEVIAWQPLPDPYKPEEKPKFSNEELDAIMDKILDTTQEEPQPNFYTERFNRVI